MNVGIIRPLAMAVVAACALYATTSTQAKILGNGISLNGNAANGLQATPLGGSLRVTAVRLATPGR